MNILGISGLENGESFKRVCCPGWTDREYLTCQPYDAAAALVIDGSIVAAAAEERFTRQKHTGQPDRTEETYTESSLELLNRDTSGVVRSHGLWGRVGHD